jgi:hypothetical protein
MRRKASTFALSRWQFVLHVLTPPSSPLRQKTSCVCFAHLVGLGSRASCVSLDHLTCRTMPCISVCTHLSQRVLPRPAALYRPANAAGPRAYTPRPMRGETSGAQLTFGLGVLAQSKALALENSALGILHVLRSQGCPVHIQDAFCTKHRMTAAPCSPLPLSSGLQG